MSLKQDLQLRKKQFIISFSLDEERLDKLDRGLEIEANFKGRKFKLQKR